MSLRRRGGDSLGVFQREQGGVRVARARAGRAPTRGARRRRQRTRLLRRVFEFWPPQVGVHVRSQAGGVRPGPEPRTGHGRDGGDGAWRQLFADGGRRRGRGGRRFLFAFLLVPLRSLRRPRESRRRRRDDGEHRRVSFTAAPRRVRRRGSARGTWEFHVVRGDVRVPGGGGAGGCVPARRRRRRRYPRHRRRRQFRRVGATLELRTRKRRAAGKRRRRLTRVHQRSVRGRGRAAVSIRRRVRHGRHRRVVGADSVRDADVFRRRRRSRARHGRVHKRGRGLRGGADVLRTARGGVRAQPGTARGDVRRRDGGERVRRGVHRRRTRVV